MEIVVDKTSITATKSGQHDNLKRPETPNIAKSD